LQPIFSNNNANSLSLTRANSFGFSSANSLSGTSDK
jgi:hypothetical protein